MAAAFDEDEATYDEVFPRVEPSESGDSVEDIFGKSDIKNILRSLNSPGDGDEEEVLPFGGRLEWMRKDVERAPPHYKISTRELSIMETYQIHVLEIRENGTVLFLFDDEVARNTMKSIKAEMEELYPSARIRNPCLRLRGFDELYTGQFVVARIEEPGSCKVRFVRAKTLMLLPSRGTAIVKDVDDDREYQVPYPYLYSLTTKIAKEKSVVMEGRLEEMAGLGHRRILAEVLKRFPLFERKMRMKFFGQCDPSSLPIIRLCDVKDNMGVVHTHLAEYVQQHATYVLTPMVSLFEDNATCRIAEILNPTELWLCPGPNCWVLCLIEERLKAAVDTIKHVCEEYPLQVKNFKSEESRKQMYVLSNYRNELQIMPRRAKIIRIEDNAEALVRVIDYGFELKVPISDLQPITLCDELLSMIPAQSLVVKIASPRDDVISGAAIKADGRSLRAQLLEEGRDDEPPIVRIMDLEDIY